MTEATRELFQQAPRTGPWIIGYVLSICAFFAASSAGIVNSPGTAAPFWIPVLGCTGMIIYTSWKRHRMLGTLSDAVRTFWRRIVISAGFMFGSFCLLAFGQIIGEWSEQVLQLIEYLPILGFAGMIWCVHQYTIDEDDEYLRSQAIRQLLIASFATLMGGLLWSGIIQMGLVDPTDIGQIILLWFGGLGIGRVYNEMRP